MNSPHIQLDQRKLKDFCLRWNITELALFGSVLHDDFSNESDVDVLVSFSPGATPDFFELHTMNEELSAIMNGRKVDLVTRKYLSPRIASRVLAELQVQYAA